MDLYDFLDKVEYKIDQFIDVFFWIIIYGTIIGGGLFLNISLVQTLIEL